MKFQVFLSNNDTENLSYNGWIEAYNLKFCVWEFIDFEQ